MRKPLLLLAFVLTVSLAASAQTPTSSSDTSATPTPASASPAVSPPVPPKPEDHRPPPPIDGWPGVFKYKDANATLPPPAPGEKRVVMYGDSITQIWAGDKSFFPGKPYIGRGISGQTTMQMVVRFRSDVIDLHPAAVVILAGTNDIAQNGGPESLKLIEDDLRSMAELAVANHIVPILCSILPASDYPWRKGLEPGPKIVEVNQWIQNYCQEQHLVFLNYYPAMVGDNQGMRADLSRDGVHPDSAGFAIMAPMAEDAVRQALP